MVWSLATTACNVLRIHALSLIFGVAVHRAIEHHIHELLIGNQPSTVEELLAEYQSE